MKTIAAQPFDFTFDPAHTALIVIDMQRDFIEPGGFGETLGNDVSLLEKIVPTVGRLIEAFRIAKLPIIHTRECHKPDLSDLPKAKQLRGKPSQRIGDPGPMGRILIAGERGADIVPALAAKPGEIVLDKPGKGAFYGTPLSSILAGRKISHLVFSGVTTEVCVQSTMREANDRGFYCLLAEDATESYFPEFKKATIDMIRAQGAIVGWTATVDQIAKALK
jgi:nicotinamidase-related amidase